MAYFWVVQVNKVKPVRAWAVGQKGAMHKVPHMYHNFPMSFAIYESLAEAKMVKDERTTVFEVKIMRPTQKRKGRK